MNYLMQLYQIYTVYELLIMIILLFALFGITGLVSRSEGKSIQMLKLHLLSPIWFIILFGVTRAIVQIIFKEILDLGDTDLYLGTKPIMAVLVLLQLLTLSTLTSEYIAEKRKGDFDPDHVVRKYFSHLLNTGGVLLLLSAAMSPFVAPSIRYSLLLLCTSGALILGANYLSARSLLWDRTGERRGKKLINER